MAQACLADELKRVTGGGPPEAGHLPPLEYQDAANDARGIQDRAAEWRKKLEAHEKQSGIKDQK